jgi:hypothetical protein
MTRRIVLMGSILALAAMPAMGTMVLTFDDVSATATYEQIPGAYGGLDWQNMYVQNRNQSSVQGSGYVSGTVSGDYTAFNGFASAATVHDGAFNFVGAYFTSAWLPTLQIQLDGYENGALKYSTVVTANQTGPTWFTLNYDGIDTLRFTSLSNSQFAMDNFTFNPVPAPGAALLLVVGVSLVGWLKRRLA